MGFLDKFKFTSNFDDEEENEEEYAAVEEEEIIEPQQPQQRTVEQAPTAQQKPSRPVAPNVKLDGAALELKVVKPERYDVVPQVADHLLNRRTVVLNLEATNKETSRRIIDFLSGVAYAIDGRLSKVAVNTYLITPANINVSGEALLDEKSDAVKAEEAIYSED